MEIKNSITVPVGEQISISEQEGLPQKILNYKPHSHRSR